MKKKHLHRKPAVQPAAVRPENTFRLSLSFPWTVVAGILAVTFISFFPSLQNGFVFWDDPEYVINNESIKSGSLKELFSSYVLGNYHPFTMLSYAAEFRLFGVDPFWYHLDNILLHLINTFLVFVLLRRLTGDKRLLLASVCSILFAVHPMHVESVTWISERKDVLYSFFFLLSLITYAGYSIQGSLALYCGALILFVCSLLSKGQAVVLAPILLLIDYFLKKKWNFRLVLEKVPFFVLALIFGLISVEAQKSAAALGGEVKLEARNLFFGMYGLALYLYKIFVPVNLSGIHPYPIDQEGVFKWFLYSSPVVMISLLFVAYRYFRSQSIITFGVSFFVISILPVLKFIPVGDAMISERYSYIPYIGIFMIAGYGLEKLIYRDQLLPYRKLIYSLAGLFLLSLCFLTWQRTRIWKDSMTFWMDVSEKYPRYWRAHSNIGQAWYDAGEYDKAIASYTKAAAVDEYCPPIPYLWRGITYLEKLKNYDLAIADFKKVLSFPNKSDGSQLDGRLNLGLAYYRKRDFGNAMNVFNETVLLYPGNATAWFDRALVYAAAGQPDSAALFYSRSLELQPGNPDAYLNRGALYTDQLLRYDLGIADFKKVLELLPDHFDATVNTGVALYKKGEYDEALKYYDAGLRIRADGKIFYLRALVHAARGDFGTALRDGQKARAAGVEVGEDLLKLWEQKSNTK